MWVKLTSLRSRVNVISTFVTEINTFYVYSLREISILLSFKWNEHLCGRGLTWQQIRVFCICYFSKRKSKPVGKNTGWCFAIKLTTTSKNSDTFEEKKEKTENRYLSPFMTSFFRYLFTPFFRNFNPIRCIARKPVKYRIIFVLILGIIYFMKCSWIIKLECQFCPFCPWKGVLMGLRFPHSVVFNMLL